jgi:hypothetical protein
MFKIDFKKDFDLKDIDIWKVNQIALKNSWEKIKTLSRKNAPYDSWKLRQSINVEPWVVSKNTKRIVIWPRKLVYAPMQEFGGTILPKKWRYLHFKSKKTGNWVRIKKAIIKWHFYMKKAFEASWKILEKEFSKAIDIVLKKL